MSEADVNGPGPCSGPSSRRNTPAQTARDKAHAAVFFLLIFFLVRLESTDGHDRENMYENR